MMKMEYLVQQDMIQREKQEMQQIYGSKKSCRQENRLEIGNEEMNILKIEKIKRCNKYMVKKKIQENRSETGDEEINILKKLKKKITLNLKAFL